MNPTHAQIFYKEVLKIHQKIGKSATDDQIDWQQKCTFLEKLMVKVFVVATSDEQIQFTNLFARISYAGQKFEIDKKTEFQLHAFRRMVRENQLKKSFSEWEQVYELGLKILPKIIHQIWKIEIPEAIAAIQPKFVSIQIKQTQSVDFQPFVRVALMEDNPEKECFLAKSESSGSEVVVRYNLPERNANFSPTIREIRKTFGFPLTVNLIDVEIDKKGILYPRAIVVEPDFLVDVTAIADCFQADHQEPMLYLLKKLMPFQSSSALIIGNIANFFLDELMTNPDAQFKKLFPKVFSLFPLRFAMMTDRQVRDIMQASQGHFLVIKNMVKTDFLKNDIDRNYCYLEPTFFSEKYGLQGRLDVFHHAEKSAIIELKSGKAFMPNSYGLSNNHFIQTLLYDLLIKSTFENKIKPTNFILYSSSADKPLRFAPAVKSQQMEAIQVRNQLVAIERKLAALTANGSNLHDGTATILTKMIPQLFPQIKGFYARDLEAFEKTFNSLTPLERKYFSAFVGFIAREQQMAKIGIQGIENANGLAALWLNNFKEKESNFDIISHLEILDNQADTTEPTIIFKKTEKTNPLANFRIGDIAALYPFQSEEDSLLRHQIFKVTIVDLNNESVTVRLRSQQFNQSIFEQNKVWSIEHDMLDSSFVGMYRGLYEFAAAKREKKELLLNLRPPAEPEPITLNLPDELTAEQKKIFRKIIASKDYFLLWGPPGTGKTSKMLKNLAGHYFHQTDENILILAYTNRAVDEICEAIENLGQEVANSYIRIGSRFGTDPRFRSKLLEKKIEPAQTRAELLKIIHGHRIFVATLSSFSTKTELLEMIKFKRVIIDEASQVLEPMLIGFLPQFEHFTLIGDHKQLPAVVVQGEKMSATNDEDLEKIGLKNMRNSLFERLFLQGEKNGWTWASDRLSHQGRMHQEIMDFPNSYFYGGHLKILPSDVEYQKIQLQNVDYQSFEPNSPLEKMIINQRVLFVPTQPDMEDGFQKTNKFEAQKIVELIEIFQNIFAKTGRQMSIGVITPYRAQIALITSELSKKLTDANNITIDTVERYQGGARDVILISLCTNTDSQLASMTSLMDDGTDRKLNVALTRARHHLVVVGNPDLLSGNELYDQFLKQYQPSTV